MRRIEWIVGEMNNGNTIAETKSVLKGNGSTLIPRSSAVGPVSQKLNLYYSSRTFRPEYTKSMITRAVMREEATAIINGITKIEKGATKADGQQTEKVLCLARKRVVTPIRFF